MRTSMLTSTGERILTAQLSEPVSYRLSRLSVTYTAKLKPHLIRTIANLKAAVDAAPQHLRLPQPQRLPRRAWRVWYLKSPFRDTIRKKHYVFQDWRYRFTFTQVADVRPIISTVLGSATRETSATVDFAWHFPGRGNYAAEKDVEGLIRRGRENYLSKNKAWLQQSQGGWRQQYAHWNFKQYVPVEDR